MMHTKGYWPTRQKWHPDYHLKDFTENMMLPTPNLERSPVAIALQAAKDYMEVSESSGHALHMPSHIYLRLGNWSKSLDSNLQSIEVK